MYGRIVERILCSGNTEEPGTLLESFGAHTRNFHQFFAGVEGSILGTIIDDILRQLRT